MIVQEGNHKEDPVKQRHEELDPSKNQKKKNHQLHMLCIHAFHIMHARPLHNRDQTGSTFTAQLQQYKLRSQ